MSAQVPALGDTVQVVAPDRVATGRVGSVVAVSYRVEFLEGQSFGVYDAADLAVWTLPALEEAEDES